MEPYISVSASARKVKPPSDKSNSNCWEGKGAGGPEWIQHLINVKAIRSHVVLLIHDVFCLA